MNSNASLCVFFTWKRLRYILETAYGTHSDMVPLSRESKTMDVGAVADINTSHLASHSL